MNALFKRLRAPDRQETQLAYEASYYPAALLDDRHKLVWESSSFLSMLEIEVNLVNDCHLARESQQGTSLFYIHWLFNNVPTEIEWKRFSPKQLFKVEYRISPLIKDGNGRVALISVSHLNSPRYILPEDPTNV